MAIGQPLTRLGFIDSARDSKGHNKQRSCIFIQHHALYDGTSLQLLFEEVTKAYSQPSDYIRRDYKPPRATIQTFIKHATTVDKGDEQRFWRNQCLGIEAVPFPALPHHGCIPKAHSVCRRVIDNISFSKKDVTASTIIRAAWAILTAQYTAVDDVSFGVLVTGRQAPIDGIEGIIAPLIAALPIRLVLDSQERLERFLERIHQQSVEMIAYEHTEFLDIRRINADTEQATNFSTLLVIQPPPISKDERDTDSLSPFKSRIELSSSASSGLGNFNPHALMVTCQLSHDDNLGLELSFDSKVIDATQAERLASQMEHVLRQISVSESVSLRELDVMSPEDVTELWKWNAQVPCAVQISVQERLVQTVNLQPMAQAICAWDGSFTYKRLHELSDQLANHLIDTGVKNGDVLALCFQKSMWQPVAALGAIKAGATCVAMDVQQPEERLRTICNQVEPKLVLASADRFELASHIANAEVVVVDAARFSGKTCSSTANLHTSESKFCPSDVLYILFTSGSTGVPKGVVMTNEAFSSAISHQGEALLVGKDSRVFDFVSYSFDITWSNLLNTLILGGCLCIPSEWERLNDLAGAFNRLGANYIHFPPSVAASLTPAALPSLKTLAMGGEPLLNVEFSRWTHVKDILGIYGPAECAQGAMSIDPLNAKSPNNHIGRPFGARIWLVQPGRPEKLVPIGAVGELLIEGPTLAREYLGDPDRTAAAFLNAPEWLRCGASDHQGRTSRVYKTGDLLRYNSDGTLTFIGRKDGMIKLRGQRIELSEIESHVRSSLHDPSLCEAIAAELIKPKDAQNPVIAIFIKLVPTKKAIDDLQAKLKLVFKGVEKRLSEHLPRYMLPQAYIALEEIPFTGTNKINRRRLREIGNTYTTAMLAEMHLNEPDNDFRVPNTVMETRLQALWSAILSIDSSSIGADSNFFRVGGESIAAMRLVAAARQQHLSLSVADIFRHPRLCELAQVISPTTGEEGEEALQRYRSLSLLPANIDPVSFVSKSVLPLLAPTTTGNVRDVLPTTDFQTQAILDNFQDPPGRWPQYTVDLPPDVDLARLRQACEMLVNHFDILRTVFVEIENQFLQVQMEHVTAQFEQFEAEDQEMDPFINSLCDEDLRRKRNLGSVFMRFTVVVHTTQRPKLILRISHALFDGYCLSSIFTTLTGLYRSESIPPTPLFAQVLAFDQQREAQSLSYWTHRLQNSHYPSWSTTNISSHPSTPSTVSDRLAFSESMPLPTSTSSSPFSLATSFHAACCIILSQLSHQEDLILGRLVTGRSTLPAPLQPVLGPCLSETPIRIHITPKDTLASVASRLHEQFLEDAPHERLGMKRIARECTDWSPAQEDFGWRSAFQQDEGGVGAEEGVEGGGFHFLGQRSDFRVHDGPMLPRPRPEIYATPDVKAGKLVLSFEGDRRVIKEGVAREVVAGVRDLLADM